MNDLQWYDFFRLLNTSLAAWALWRMRSKYKKREFQWSLQLMDIGWFVFATCFLTIVGQLEQILQDVEYGSRMFLTFLLMLLALKVTREGKEPLQKF